MGAVKLYERLATGLEPNTRIETNPEPLGLEDDLLGYTINTHYKPLIKVKDMLAIERELRKDEDPVAEVGKVILRRIAHHTTRHLYKHQHKEIEVYGERYPGHESRALEIADDLALETRLFPSLALFRQRTITRRGEPRPEPEAVLRLDTLVRYNDEPSDKRSRDTYITAKSGIPDEERSNSISLGMLHLARLLDGKHEMLFFTPQDIIADFGYLEQGLKSHKMKLTTYRINESTEDIDGAARYAIERYSERETIIVPRRKLRLAAAG